MIISHQNRKDRLNYICPFYGYKHPCLHELKKGTCKALHIEIIRDIFEIQREFYNRTKGSIQEGEIERLIVDKEPNGMTRERLQLYKGLLRNYPAKPNTEDINKAKRLQEEKEFQEIAMKMRSGEYTDGEEDDMF